MSNGVSRRFGAAVVVLTAWCAIGSAWQPESHPAPTQPTTTPQPGSNAPAPNAPGSNAPNSNAPARQPGERGPRNGGQPGERGPGGPQASVGGSMKGMNRAMKQLKNQNQIADAVKKDENLKLIDDMERACTTAKSQPVPAELLAKATDEAGKAKLTAEFRKDLMGALRLMLDIEQDIIDGKGEEAGKKLDELIKKAEHAHKEMGVDED